MSNGYLSSVPAVLVVRIIVNGRDDHCDDDDGNDESICSPPKISWAACSWQGALKDGFGETLDFQIINTILDSFRWLSL